MTHAYWNDWYLGWAGYFGSVLSFYCFRASETGAIPTGRTAGTTNSQEKTRSIFSMKDMPQEKLIAKCIAR